MDVYASLTAELPGHGAEEATGTITVAPDGQVRMFIRATRAGEPGPLMDEEDLEQPSGLDEDAPPDPADDAVRYPDEYESGPVPDLGGPVPVALAC